MKERANANGSILPNGVNEGVLVVSLHAGGQAEKGGLQMGDVIIECESRKIKNADEFVDVLNEEFLLKKNLRVVVLRGKKRKEDSTKYSTRSALITDLFCAAREAFT